MSDNLKEQLEEIEYNRMLLEKQIRKAKKGKLLLPPGNELTEISPGAILCILKDQLLDLEIQEAEIKTQMEEENCSEKN